MPKVVIAISRPDDMPWELVLNMRQLRRFQELQQLISSTDWEQKPQDQPVEDEPDESAPAEEGTPPQGAVKLTPEALLDLLDKASRREQE